MPLIDIPFKQIAMDLVGPIHPPTEKGHRFILTVMDYATRYPECVALKHIDTITVAEALVEIYSRMGVPAEVLTDCGTAFTSDLMKEVSRLLSVKQLTTTPFHPICNGLIEKFNGTLKQMLKRMCSERPRDWDRYLAPLLFAYREAPQESLGFSPFELLYGRSVRGPMTILRELWTKEHSNAEVKSTYQYILDLKNRLHETCDLAQRMLSKSSARYKRYYDQRRRSRELNIGDQVLILLPTDSNKLLMQWKGPYEIVGKFNECDYRVNVKDKIRSYHINLLKKYVTRSNPEIQNGLFDIVADTDIECFITNVDSFEPTEAFQSAEVFHTDLVDNTENGESFGKIVPLPSCNRTEFPSDVTLNPELTSEQRSNLNSLLEKYSDIVTDVPLKTNAMTCEIRLTTEDPVRCKPYPVPYARREAIKQEVNKMLELGVIERSNSPYAAPVVMVPKKDNTVRFCIDYRRLNKVTVFDPEPMPNPEDLFTELTKSNYLSKIDISKAYWQIPMTEESKPKTAFVTPDAQYQFLYMPFGVQCAPSVCTRLMRKLFSKISNVVNYIDDILIHTISWEDHLKTLENVFSILQEANLSDRPSKCFLGYTDVEFLGHQVGNGKLATNPVLLKKIENTVPPKTKKELRSFLGFVGYYRKFVPNFAKICLPLTDLTKKGQPDKINWGEAQDSAYKTLKHMLSSPPVLHLPDFSQTFYLRTDASEKGIAAILMQKEQDIMFLIAYASRKLLPREQNYSTIEKECLAIVWALDKFELYLSGRYFVIQTDHQPLTCVNKVKVSNKRIMRWAMFLQEFRFRIESIPGKSNFGPDFLSRVPSD